MNNLPAIEQINKILTELNELSLQDISYDTIFEKLATELKIIPFVTAILKKGNYIERGRINGQEQIFNSESELSYRTDNENIKEYGRANCPGQSMFYGAVKSEFIDYPRIVNLFEISDLFRDGDLISDGEFIFTVGKWKIKKDFEVVEIVFDKKTIERIPEIRKAYEYHLDNLKKDFPDKIEEYSAVLEFFSNEFAKKDISSDNDYKISAVYTNMAIENKGHKGVLYPSVRTEGQGRNVVLPIETVDKYLELEKVAMFKIVKHGDKAEISNIAVALELGENNAEFNWIYN
ncbi:hypothetical protein [Paludibacter sp.]|uniref:hypothetical protein n=1 Tax=Paludibacter sp. TaxID=1898105 RepID=UPI0013533F3C|nr:hypothetical protein [Paludibacter sp.]MTK53518.1 hypothetical protein [Paludibacter sp.]